MRPWSLLTTAALAVELRLLCAELFDAEAEREAARESEASALSIARSYRGFAAQGGLCPARGPRVADTPAGRKERKQRTKEPPDHVAGHGVAQQAEGIGHTGRPPKGPGKDSLESGGFAHSERAAP